MAGVAEAAACRDSPENQASQGSRVDRANPEVRAGLGEQEEQALTAAEAVTVEPVVRGTAAVTVAMEAVRGRNSNLEAAGAVSR